MKMLTRNLKNLAACAALVGLAGVAQAADTNRYLVQYDDGSKATVMAALPVGSVVHHEFDTIGIMAVSMPSAAADAIAAMSVVSGVAEDPVWQLYAQDTPYGIDMVRARDQWDADRDGIIDSGAATGGGIRLCIVDTGILAAHEDLGAGGVNIIAGQSWVDEDWSFDQQGHGTHVAGTVAAMNNDTGVVGVSPGTVDLLIADVFNDNGDGQFSSTILEATQWCADNGANIISMSLGGNVPLITTGGDEIVELGTGYREVYERGVLIIAAAGNDGGPVRSYPASYDSVVSVAAIDSDEAVASFSNFVPAVEVAAPGVDVLSSYPVDTSLSVANGPSYSGNSIANIEPAKGTFSGPLMDGGNCNTPPAPGAYQDALVLCVRGGATFGVKIDNAAAGGAAGAIIYNNEPGNFNGTYGQVCCSSIPAISLSQADGQDALNYLSQSADMKVDDTSTTTYVQLSGTSMATPHASAVAAVHWSACSSLTHDQVRSHLAATTRESLADPVPGRDIFYGYGITQAKDGVDALRDGVDEYDASVGNADGSNPANVECPDTTTEGDSSAKGAGWISNGSHASDKINFNFKAEESSNGPQGKVMLRDDEADVKIDARELTGLARLTQACGPVAAGDNAVEITANGTYNGQPASFRACAADVAKQGRGNDLFYLECTSGCVYDTTSAGSDGVLGGGNVKVQMAGGASGTSGEASTASLGPALLDSALAGAVQVLTVEVHDDAGAALADATVQLKAMFPDGSVDIYEATTGATGIAVFAATVPDDSVEYVAVAGGVESNTVAITPR